MAAKYKDRIKAALDNFDLAAAERLVDELVSAENDGYEFTVQENRLWDRLWTCIERYRHTSTLID
jgi:hypothetical protein